MTWPVVELDPITRLRAIAAAYPNAGVAEAVVDVPFEEAWAWVTDFERNVHRFDTEVAKIRIRHRDGGRVRLWAWARFVPIPLPFDVTVEDGFCIMRGRVRAFLVVMAAAPTADGRTRYVHAEAVPLPGVGWLRRLVQRVVDRDVRGFVRHVGT